MRRPVRPGEWAALTAITLVAAALRLIALEHVSPDPFYDAAVRSMTLSWHNFFFGAFEPGGSVSIDKPPIDLWLQVASVKLLGFSSTTLKLPEALGDTAAVPLLFAAVRRMWTTTAGLAAAAALAILPVDVITARSDTMDGVMMMLIVLALLLVVCTCQSGRIGLLLAAAAVLGVAFNVKLLESVVAVPGLGVLAAIGLPWPARRRALALLAATGVYVVVALSWLTATLLVPAHERPYAIGSTNGSAWNAAFVFNGTERLSGSSPEPQTLFQPHHHYAEATQSERDRIPIVPPSPTRLLARIGPLSGERLGLELLVALVLGIPALAWGLRGDPADRDADRAREHTRMRRAVAAGLGVWMLVGIVLFSHMTRLHPRYVEGFTPAVAAMLGIGVAWAAHVRGRTQLLALLVALAASAYYVERLLYGTSAVFWIALVGALATAACAVFAYAAAPRSSAARPGGSARPVPAFARRNASVAYAATISLALVAVLALPLKADVIAVKEHVTDAGYVGALPREEQRLVSAYLRAHQGTAHYEVAAESATQIGSLIVQDARPVLILTTYAGRVFTTVDQLQRLLADGRVRYAFLTTACDPRAPYQNPACSAPVRWIVAHAKDVSRDAGLRPRVLWLLPGARA